MGHFLAVFLLVAGLVGCANNRGGFSDQVLDRTLYQADTKAERLLRYYQIQALLVRFAAENGGPDAERVNVALANTVATVKLVELLDCLRLGSVEIPGAANPNTRTDHIRRNYCSFFESRLIKYEGSIWSMLRMSVRYDDEAAVLRQTITGINVLDFANVVSAFAKIAGRFIRDERILQAFLGDALELQFLVHEPGIQGPTAVDPNASAYRGRRPEIDDRERVRAHIAERGRAGRPTVLTWHFAEVTSFMISACQSLNGDALLAGGNLQCSTGLPFVTPAVSSGAPE